MARLPSERFDEHIEGEAAARIQAEAQIANTLQREGKVANRTEALQAARVLLAGRALRDVTEVMLEAETDPESEPAEVQSPGPRG